MKNLKFAIIILAAMFLTANALPAYTGDDETTVNTPTLVCNLCKKSVTFSLKQLDGVQKVSVDLKNKKVTVTYDDTKTSVEAIENAITTAGYDANDKKADPNAYEKLDDCCKIGEH